MLTTNLDGLILYKKTSISGTFSGWGWGGDYQPKIVVKEHLDLYEIANTKFSFDLALTFEVVIFIDN